MSQLCKHVARTDSKLKVMGYLDALLQQLNSHEIELAM